MANQVLVQGKSLLASKEFWINALGGGIELAQLLGQAQIIPPGTAGLTSAVITILLRRFSTSQPVTSVLPQGSIQPAASVPAASLLQVARHEEAEQEKISPSADCQGK